ncbi:MAG: VIT1/CCC1 transporter family protein, partial [Gammaproteobacteria bacterium]
VILAPLAYMVPAVSAACLVYLAVLGVIGARVGGANPVRAAMRIAFWGALALAVTAGIGSLLGTAV